MPEHEEVRVPGHLMAGEDFRLAEKMTDEVEGMDVEVEQCIAFGICACLVMQGVTDKMLFAEALLQESYGRSIAFLQANHSNRRKATGRRAMLGNAVEPS